MKKKSTLKFGIISTASVLDYGFMPGVKLTDGVEVAAIGSRNIDKARATAEKFKIPKYYGSYQAVLRDPEIDCIYIPLPNSMHGEWARKALRAGKHVLCEKPLAWSAKEASSLKSLVKSSGLTFAEAFQYRYHPMMLKVGEIIRSGKIGNVVKVEASYCEIIPNRKQVQFQPEMSGGAMMDVGCYAVNFCRYAAGCNDAEVISSKTKIINGVDGETRAELRFSNGIKAVAIGSIIKTVPSYAVVAGTKGSIFIHAPFASALLVNDKITDYYVCIVQRGSEIKEIRTKPLQVTYACQLAAFRDAVHEGKQPLIDLDDAIANMALIDKILKAGGVKLAYPKKYKP